MKKFKCFSVSVKEEKDQLLISIISNDELTYVRYKLINKESLDDLLKEVKELDDLLSNSKYLL